MAVAAREDLLAAGLAVFDRDGFRGRDGGGHPHPRAGVQRQLLPFLRIEEGTGRHAVPGSARRYHAAILAAIDASWARGRASAG